MLAIGLSVDAGFLVSSWPGHTVGVVDLGSFFVCV